MAAKIIYNLYFHPLSHFKGPPLWKVFRFPFVIALVRGSLPHDIRDIHEAYGDVVRVGPDELSFTNPAAWRDIYGKNFARSPLYSNKPPGKDADNLVSASESDHTRFRKVLAPVFSQRSVDKYEKIARIHVDRLIAKLHRTIGVDRSGFAAADVLKWYNYCALDIIGDFIWSTSFECLGRDQYPHWMKVITEFKVAMWRVATKYYPPVDTVLHLILAKLATKSLLPVWESIDERLSQRLEKPGQFIDVISHIISANSAASDIHMSQAEIEINTLLLMVAGSESVTTVLTGVTNYLLRDSNKLQRLICEIRSEFPSDRDITGSSVSNLPYLNAVIQEGMRLCPTIPDGMRRITPPGGALVAGHFVSGGVTVSVPQWATYGSQSNFNFPASFQPERWLTMDTSMLDCCRVDQKDAFNPFSLGPHNCPGKALAYLEMRLILANLLWNFDIARPVDMNLPTWEKQKIYWFWVKEPTYVAFRRVTRPG